MKMGQTSYLASSTSGQSESDQRPKVGTFYAVCIHYNRQINYTLHAFDCTHLISNHRTSRKFEFDPMPKPVLKLPSEKYPPEMGFFAFGSKVYMIGGRFGRRFDFNSKPLRDVYVYESSTKVVTRATSRMNSGKCNPQILGPCGGKFYIFNSNLAEGDFELFDPETESWTVLPRPPVSLKNKYVKVRECRIMQHALIDHHIFLSACESTVFHFDLLSNAWDVRTLCSGTSVFPNLDGARYVDGRLYGFCMNLKNPLWAYDFDVGAGFSRRPVLDLMPWFKLPRLCPNNFFLPLEKGWFCVARVSFDEESRDPQIFTIDIFQLSDGDKQGEIRTTNHYSFKFIVEFGSQMCDQLISCFPICY